MSTIIKPRGRRRVHLIELTPPGFDKPKRLSAYRDLSQTQRFKARVDLLVEARHNASPPPKELSAWIEAMPPKKAKRLGELGLLDRPRFEGAKKIDAHIEDYQREVASRKTNTASHAQNTARLVRRVCDKLKIEYFNQLSAHDVQTVVKDFTTRAKLPQNRKPLSPNHRRHYLIALRDFGRWMLRDRRTMDNPLEQLQIPAQDGEGTHVRAPLTVEELTALLLHLDTAEDKHPSPIWTPADRRMIYWTAACTALRQNELAQLRKAHLDLDHDPPFVRLPGGLSKGGKGGGDVPLPPDLADALRGYTAHLMPESAIFRFPASRKTIADRLARDLTGAKIPTVTATGEVRDFHTFRSTAITNWLDVYGLPEKWVQEIARLKTLSLVQRYSRKFKLRDYSWVKNAPKLTGLTAKDTKTA